jgi:hypothetical protein
MKNILKNKWVKFRTKKPYQKINDIHKLIFIHIPKNAGISIEESLFGAKVGHKTIRQFESHDKKKYVNYFKFTIVRNPYDRLVSAFYFLKKGGRNSKDKDWAEKNLKGIEDFEQFLYLLKNKDFANVILKWQHFTPQYKYLINSSNEVNLDFVLKFENLESDFQKLTQRINFKSMKLEHKNKSKRKNWSEYYNPETKLIIYELYRKDFELFYKELYV